MTAIEITLAALVTVLGLLAQHWFPWPMLLRRKLPRLAAYALGVLGMLLPLSGLYAWWAASGQTWRWAWIVAMWVVALVGGLAVSFAYALDYVLHRLAQRLELSELLEMRDEVEYGETGTNSRGNG